MLDAACFQFSLQVDLQPGSVRLDGHAASHPAPADPGNRADYGGLATLHDEFGNDAFLQADAAVRVFGICHEGADTRR